ncbi:hypothetical protein TWF696_008414 [Orbilia brochopaga]|uniref:Uncharacterized protein n=1 Tax=Orbilia brochopaga TaxID=3140254 RepID=A0AAV9UH55_9PEZI
MIPYLRLSFVCLASVGFEVAAGFIGGWASREFGVCATNEVSCGTRGPGFSACCPSGTFCLGPVSIPGYTDNTGCCPTPDDCTIEIQTYQICAHDSWNLYNASGFPFCCVAGEQGGLGSSNYDSCRKGPLPPNESPLPKATGGTRPTTAPTSPMLAPTSAGNPAATPATGPADSTGSDSSPPSPTTSKKMSTGAIAGIVVGSVLGVALLGFAAWWVGREVGIRMGHRRGGERGIIDEFGGIDDGAPPTYRESKPALYPPAPTPPAPPVPQPWELVGNHLPLTNELAGNHLPPANELPA